MMLRNETWMVALEALWANKVRAFLTTLGVIIGSACIVLVVTVALSGRRYVIAQIEGVGSNLMFPFADSVGRNLRVGEFSYTVIGVFKERVETFGLSEIQDYSVLIPFPLMKYYTGDTSLEMLYAQAGTPEGVIPVTRQLEALLRSRHPTRARYQVMNLSSILDAARKIALALTIVLVLIGFIALLVSGIGIMNIMLVTVRERTREIGIRKAIGARHQEILYQYLLEAFMISGFGSVLGF